MHSRTQTLSEENVFEVLYGAEGEFSEEYSYIGEKLDTISEKLDTVIEYENGIHYAIWTLIGVISFVVVARLLWTAFDKWFFGGI